MPYITPEQIAILDDLGARLDLVDPDDWVRRQAMFASEPPLHGIADLTDRDAALLILMWRRELEAKLAVSERPQTSRTKKKASLKVPEAR